MLASTVTAMRRPDFRHLIIGKSQGIPTRLPHHGTVISAYVILKWTVAVVSRDYNRRQAKPVLSRESRRLDQFLLGGH
jgi:hypothetical protein